MANLTFPKLANEAERKHPKKSLASFCYFGKSKCPKPCQIGKNPCQKRVFRNDPYRKSESRYGEYFTLSKIGNSSYCRSAFMLLVVLGVRCSMPHTLFFFPGSRRTRTKFMKTNTHRKKYGETDQLKNPTAKLTLTIIVQCALYQAV